MTALLEAFGIPVTDDVQGAVAAEARVVRSTRGAPRGAGTLTRRQAMDVTRIAGALLRELGYDPREHGFPHVPERVAAAARAVHERVSPRRARSAPAADPRAGWTPHQDQVLLDDVLTALRTGGRLDGLLAQGATLRIVGPGGGSWHGPRGVDAFLGALADDPLVTGDYVSADVHPGGGLVVLTAALTSHGGAVDRTVIVRPSGDHVQEVIVYRHPVAASSDP
jgi:hypothetical protein